MTIRGVNIIQYQPLAMTMPVRFLAEILHNRKINGFKMRDFHAFCVIFTR